MGLEVIPFILELSSAAPTVRWGGSGKGFISLRACAVFEEDLAAPLSRTTAEWNQSIAKAMTAAGAGTATGAGEEESAITAEILTSLVEGISGRWLSGSISTDHARALLTTAIDALSK